MKIPPTLNQALDHMEQDPGMIKNLKAMTLNQETPTQSDWEAELSNCKWCNEPFQKWHNPCSTSPKHQLYNFGDDEIKLVNRLLATSQQETLERVVEGAEKIIDEYRCPIHQQKGKDGNWYILPPDHKLCHEGWIAPRGDIAIQQFIKSLQETITPTKL